MWEVMQEWWRSCNAYEDAQDEECGFSIFVEVSEKNSSKEDSYWIKAHKIEAQASQIQVIHTLQQCFFFQIQKFSITSVLLKTSNLPLG